MIRVEDLWKSFGRQEVLRGVSFEVQRGEFLALIGMSGCGKSVLLKHLVGLLKPDRVPGAASPRRHEQPGSFRVARDSPGTINRARKTFLNAARLPRNN